MKAPRARGVPIDAARYEIWTEKFAGYRVQVNKARIQTWIDQFEAGHHDVAARVLDAVEFYRADQLDEAYRSVLGRLPGWSRTATCRKGRWRFAAFTTNSGESGDSMLHMFRVANKLSASRFNTLFIHRADLLKEDLGPDDTVVFVDDFAGTGDQAKNAWDSMLDELLPRRPKIFLAVAVAIDDAIRRIQAATPISVLTFRHLRSKHNFFSNDCISFSRSDKRIVRTYCERADDRNPHGYGRSGVLVVMAHRCPNNSLPILHARRDAFRGLFPR